MPCQGEKKMKKGISNDNIFMYAIISGIAGGVYIISVGLAGGHMPQAEFLIKCIGAGALAGFAPSVASRSSHHYIPLFQSWTMIVLILAFLPFLMAKNIAPYWVAFAYGYLAHLVWFGYKRRLPRI